MKNDPYLVTGTIVNPHDAQFHQPAVVATVVGGGYGDQYSPMVNPGLVVSASPMDVPAQFAPHAQYGNINSAQQYHAQTNRASTCAGGLIGGYVFLAVVLIIVGIVLMVTLPPGHCEDGCLEQTCIDESPDDDQTSFPCSCPDSTEPDGEACENLGWNGPGTAQLTAGATMLSIGSLLACCGPCWCCLVCGTMHFSNRVAVDNHNYNNQQNYQHHNY